MSSVVGRYIDWISQYVFEVYEKERERWISTQGNVRASLIHDVLGRRTVTAREFERETGYRLGGHHIGMIVWSTRTDPAPDELRMLAQVVSKMAVAARCSGPPLVTAVDRETAWVWLPFVARPSGLDMQEMQRIVGQARSCRASLGLSGVGVDGFRRTHDQAQAARRVVVTSGETTPVISFGDEGVAITSLLANDMESTSSWVAEVLGHLAVDNEQMRSLRETQRVFFLTGESYTDTAAIMKLHRNTVKYRIAKALEQGETVISSKRIDLAVALNVCHFLGPAVLTGSGGQ
jgi:DNA-binding PucR family transcriptional regulator